MSDYYSHPEVAVLGATKNKAVSASLNEAAPARLAAVRTTSEIAACTSAANGTTTPREKKKVTSSAASIEGPEALHSESFVNAHKTTKLKKSVKSTVPPDDDCAPATKTKVKKPTKTKKEKTATKATAATATTTSVSDGACQTDDDDERQKEVATAHHQDSRPPRLPNHVIPLAVGGGGGGTSPVLRFAVNDDASSVFTSLSSSFSEVTDSGSEVSLNSPRSQSLSGHKHKKIPEPAKLEVMATHMEVPWGPENPRPRIYAQTHILLEGYLHKQDRYMRFKPRYFRLFESGRLEYQKTELSTELSGMHQLLDNRWAPLYRVTDFFQTQFPSEGSFMIKWVDPSLKTLRFVCSPANCVTWRRELEDLSLHAKQNYLQPILSASEATALAGPDGAVAGEIAKQGWIFQAKGSAGFIKGNKKKVYAVLMRKGRLVLFANDTLEPRGVKASYNLFDSVHHQPLLLFETVNATQGEFRLKVAGLTDLSVQLLEFQCPPAEFQLWMTAFTNVGKGPNGVKKDAAEPDPHDHVLTTRLTPGTLTALQLSLGNE